MNNEIPKQYINLPLQEGRTVREVYIAVITKERTDLLKEEQYMQMHYALFGLFQNRNSENTPVNGFLSAAALEHYLSKSTHIYLAMLKDSHAIVGYALADRHFVHDIYVAPNYRRDRIGISLVDMIMHKNQKEEFIHFLSESKDKKKGGMGFFQAIKGIQTVSGYNKEHYSHSYMIQNRLLTLDRNIDDMVGQLRLNGVVQDVVDGKLKLDGVFSAKQLQMLTTLAELIEERG